MLWHVTWCCVIASSVAFVACCSSFPRFSSPFGHSDQPFLDWKLEVFSCLDLVKFGVYGKLVLHSFQQDWSCTILSFVQETVALGGRALELIYVISTIFPSFPMQIPVGSEILFANQENHIVDKLSIFEKILAFWTTVVRMKKILCAKMVCRMAFVGEFPAFVLVFIVFLVSGWPSSLCWI